MNNIKRLRKEKGLSVSALAAALNMSQSNLTKIENGQVELKPELTAKIADILQISPAALTQTETAANGVYVLPLLNPEIANLPPLSYLSIPQILCQNLPPKSALYAMEDDTMAPLIAQNSLVIINKDIRNFTLNGIYLLHLNDKICLRRLQQTSDQKVNILSDNAAYLPEQTDITKLNIIGKAHTVISGCQL